MLSIDSHQHFWALERGDYGWLTADLGSIYRDFLPTDLQALLAHAKVQKTILVQAATSEAETHYLLELANKFPFIGGVVGWVDFEHLDAPTHIAQMAERKVIGLRPMIQDISDTNWMLKPSLHPAFEAMIANNLRFDALIQPRHLLVLKTLIKTYPGLRVVIDHGAKPRIAEQSLQPWTDHIRAIAHDSDVYCKLSGLATEAGSDWSIDSLRQYVRVLVDAFGPYRLMWGSDWPVLNLASDYASWHSMTMELLADLSADDRALIMGGNAARFYGLNS
jgi:L-fuconolactonase